MLFKIKQKQKDLKDLILTSVNIKSPQGTTLLKTSTK